MFIFNANFTFLKMRTDFIVALANDDQKKLNQPSLKACGDKKVVPLP
jgi:hypothetical protein